MFRAIILAIPFASASLSTPTRSDPCAILCREFSAENRGNGFDLCDSNERSLCENGFCTHLYWAESDTGASGLVYGLTEADVDEDDLANPLTCAGAVGVVGRNADLNFWNVGLYAFLKLSPVREWLNSRARPFLRHPFLSALRSLTQSDGSINFAESGHIRELLSAAGDNIFSFDMDPETVYQVLAGNIMGALPLRSRFWYHVGVQSDRACTVCGYESFSMIDGPHLTLPVIRNTENGTFDFGSCFEDYARGTDDMNCPHCRPMASHNISRSIIDLNKIVLIKLDRNETMRGIETRIPDRVTFPFQTFDRNDVTQDDVHAHVDLELIGIFHENVLSRGYFVEVKVDNQWIRFDGENTIQLEERIETSQTASTVIYKPVTRPPSTR